MNQISWLIYFSNVSGNLGALLIFLGLVVLVVAIAYWTSSYVMFDNIGRWESEAARNEQLKATYKTRKYVPALIGLTFFMWITAAFMPSQETVLAIAASQVGEQMLKTPTANLAVDALNAWLKRQIAAPAPPKE